MDANYLLQCNWVTYNKRNNAIVAVDIRYARDWEQKMTTKNYKNA